MATPCGMTDKLQSLRRKLKARTDLAARSASTEYYLVDTDSDGQVPIRVSRNEFGHVIAAEITDRDGRTRIDNTFWFEAKDSPWLLEITAERYYEAVRERRGDRPALP